MSDSATGVAQEWQRILVAEDSPMIAQMMRRSLRSRCSEVDVVEDGRAAVRAALEGHLFQRPYDAVLMDLHMPVMDGSDAMAALRNAGYQGVILAVTAGDDDDHYRQALEAGADDVAVKPVDWELLYAKLQRLTSRND